MEFTRCYLPLEWEERWRREKEQRKRVLEEGGDGAEQDKQELKRIVAYNDSRMGLPSVRKDSEASKGSGRSDQQLTEETFDDNTLKYSIKTYPCDIFKILKDFWETGLLTDLTLVLESGQKYQVHSTILAAISSFVHKTLLVENCAGRIISWSLNLSPEVNNAGLEAVLEFAYTGAVPSLNEETLKSAVATARAMEIQRVLDTCSKNTKTMKSRQEGDGSSAGEQLKMTLESIEQLRKEKVGCDVVLDVDGALFHVHKVILAASSDYFRGMFTSGMRESNQTCVALPFLLASELEVLIDCSYTGHLHLNWDCVFEITCTALQLQFTPALSLCFKFMHQQMDTSSCLDVASFAEAYGMSELRNDADDFVLRNFWEVSGTAKFLDLSADKLRDVLLCDGLCAPSELAVFRAVVSWIEACPEERLGQADLLMSGVRFPLMTFREFREVRAINLRMECFENKEVELYRSALKEFGFGIQDTQAKCRVRRPKDALVLVGGDQLNPDVGRRIPSRELWFANSLRSGTGLVKEIEWKRLAEIPDQPKFRHGVASMGGRLYAVGGCYFYTKEDVMKSAYW